MIKRRLLLITLLFLLPSISAYSLPTSDRFKRVNRAIFPHLKEQLRKLDVTPGAAVYIRIFKQEEKLELWLEKKNEYFLYKTFDICTYSGELGPKLKPGDGQSPEGFYFITPQRMNPWSQFHLSFNLGYPNAYDRYYKRTGDFLMVHGSCVSIGCYAMTDQGINEIYTLVYHALKEGQSFVRVHIFPFEMNHKNMYKFRNHQWIDFWENLKQGYDIFEHSRRPPNVEVQQGSYIFQIEK